MSISRYFDITVDRLLNEEIRFYQPPAYPVSPVWPLDKKETEELIHRTKNPLGLLFLIPMFVELLAVFIMPLIDTLFRAVTDYNALNSPKFIGIENYRQLFLNDDIFQVALKNTIINTLLITLIVGTLTFVISWLIQSIHKYMRYTVVLLFDLVSVFVLAGGITCLFSGDAYGFINSRLIESGSITEPIPFLNKYAPQIQLLLRCLILFGPVLSVLSLLKPRRISENKFLWLLFPLEHSLQVYLAGGLPVLLMPICWSTVVSAVGFPYTNYSAHTLIDHFVDYGSTRFQLGYASAINVVSLLWTAAFLFAFFVLSCGTMHLIAHIKSKAALSKSVRRTHNQGKKIAAYMISGVLIFSALFTLFIVLMNSFKDISEVFVLPQKILPEKLNWRNYIDLFTMDMGNYHFSGWLFNMIVVPFLPSLIVTAVSGISAFSVAYFDYKARRILYPLILLSFISLLYGLAMFIGMVVCWIYHLKFEANEANII